MINEILIESYFEKHREGVSQEDLVKLGELRDSINSYKNRHDQIKYIIEWRKSESNRVFDKRVLDISLSAHFSKSIVDGSGNIVESTRFVNNQYWNGRIPKNLDKLEKEQSPRKRGGKSVPKAETFLKNKGFKKTGAVVGFIIGSFSFLTIAFAILNVVLFISGYISSTGSTPFIFSEARVHEGGNVYGPPKLEIEGIAKVKDGYKMPIDYGIAQSMGVTYTGKNYNGPDDVRGIGLFVSEDFEDIDSTGNFSRQNYAVSGRWEYQVYTIEPNAWPASAYMGNGTPDGIRTSGINPIYKEIDENYKTWILDQKVLIINPNNNRAVVCRVGDGSTDSAYGGKNLAPLSTGPLGLSYLAQEALGFKPEERMDGGQYESDCLQSCMERGIQLHAYWVLDPDSTPLGPANIKLEPEQLPDPPPPMAAPAG